MAIKVGMVSLGCAKNQVDGEMLMASLKNAGFELCDDAALADVAIVNTCGFIDSAKQESIDEILELATLKKEGRIKKIVVTGCLAERYREEIHKELPEVDGVFGIGANADIAASPSIRTPPYRCISSGLFPGPFAYGAKIRKERAANARLMPAIELAAWMAPHATRRKARGLQNPGLPS